MLKKFAIALGLLVGSAGLAYATGETVASWFKQSSMNPVLVQGSDGTDAKPVKVDTSGNTISVGPAADDAAAAGNPVLIGCKYNSTRNTVEDGDVSIVACGSRTGLLAGIVNPDGTQTATVSTAGADDLIAGTQLLYTANLPFLFDGTTFDRQLACNVSVAFSINNTTTQIVALSGSTFIRVCGMAITNATAGTFKFVDGTGTNCATSPSDMSGTYNLADKGNMVWDAGVSTIFTGRSGRAICGTAATGTVTGTIRYSQY